MMSNFTQDIVGEFPRGFKANFPHMASMAAAAATERGTPMKRRRWRAMRSFAQAISSEFSGGLGGEFPAYGIESRGHGYRSRNAGAAQEVLNNE